MKNKLTAFLAGVLCVVFIVTAVAQGPSLSQSNNIFYHSGSIDYTGTSQTISTTKMRLMTCDAWMFRNRSGAETAYLNLNVLDGYNGDALVSDVNMYDIPPGETIEIEDGTIKRFSIIGTGNGTLKWSCACK